MQIGWFAAARHRRSSLFAPVFWRGEGKKESGREKRSWRLEQRRQNNGRYGFRRRGKDILWLRFGGLEGWRNARDLLKLASRWLVFFFLERWNYEGIKRINVLEGGLIVVVELITWRDKILLSVETVIIPNLEFADRKLLKSGILSVMNINYEDVIGL